jgi:hypothetical protein
MKSIRTSTETALLRLEPWVQTEAMGLNREEGER